MKKKLTYGHLFLLNQFITTVVLVLVLGGYGAHLFIEAQRTLRERLEPALAQEADRIDYYFLNLESNVLKLKSLVELFDVMPGQLRLEKFRSFSSALLTTHQSHYNAYFALGPELSRIYFGKEAFVHVVHRDYLLVDQPQYNDPRTFISETFLQPGYDKDPEQQWWWMNNNSPGVNYTDFYFDKGYMEKVMFSADTGIYRDGKLIAVVGIDTLAADIGLRVGQFKVGETGGALIVDQNGRPIVPFLSKNMPLLNYRYRRAQTLDDFRALPRQTEKFFEINARGISEFQGSDGKTYLTQSRALKGRPWNLVIYQEKSEAYADLYYRLFFFGALGLVVYAILTLMVWMTGQYVINQDKAALMRLEESRDRAEAATRTKSQFLSTMSHEIRTPLNAVLGSAELLAETKLSKDQEELLNSLQSAGDTLLSMLNNILDFSKFEYGQMPLESREFLLSDLIREVQVLIAPAISRKKLEFTFHPPQFDRWIVGDSLRLKQVLINLLGNAVKFTDKGSVELTVQPYRGEEPGKEFFFFEVKDTGIGIAKENLQKIFDEFGQEDSTVTRRFGGTGLGLSISQKIVRMMGGELYCESRQLEGSRFHFSVQMRSQIGFAWATERLCDEGDQVSAEKVTDSKVINSRVLIVDDMDENHVLLKAYIKRMENVHVDSAYSGFECLELCGRHAYDLIFMDVQMPLMSGLEAIERLREMESLTGKKKAAVVVISANCFAEDIDKSLMAGADEHCGKPVRKQAVLDLVKKYSSRVKETAPC